MQYTAHLTFTSYDKILNNQCIFYSISYADMKPIVFYEIKTFPNYSTYFQLKSLISVSFLKLILYAFRTT